MITIAGHSDDIIQVTGELGSVIDTTTHWSSRVGIQLPEEE